MLFCVEIVVAAASGIERRVIAAFDDAASFDDVTFSVAGLRQTDGSRSRHPIAVYWTDVETWAKPRVERQSKQLAREAEEKASEAKAARNTGGTPLKHDWDGFWIEVALYAEKNELDPAHRPELQRHMEDWTARTSPKPPDGATIRARLARLYTARIAEQN